MTANLVERAPQPLVDAYVESLRQGEVRLDWIHNGVGYAHLEVLVAFQVLRDFAPPIKAYAPALVVLDREAEVASHAPALPAQADSGVHSGGDRRCLCKLGVHVLQRNPAADRQPVVDLVCDARIYIHGYQVAVESLVASDPVAVVIGFEPVGGSYRKRSGEFFGKLVDEVEIGDIGYFPRISAVWSLKLHAPLRSFYR